MNSDVTDRFEAELALLQSMYPDELTFHPKGREINYTPQAGQSITLRLPDAYLATALPEVAEAHIGDSDVREGIRAFLREECQSGEEIVDSVILHFNNLIVDVEEGSGKKTSNDATSLGHMQERHGNQSARKGVSDEATVIVWLHHLLNTNKRKHALSPSSSAVTGVTRPGYPGVLVYSGPAQAVYEHVSELKRLKWQAFQVRFESSVGWRFCHGSSVVEVEAIKDIVADLIGEDIKAEFLECMKIK